MKIMTLAAVAIAMHATASQAEPPPRPLPSVSVTQFNIVTSQVRMYADNPIYFGTNISNGGNYGTQTSQNVWHRDDLKPLGVPADAKAAFLSGMLIITHGTAAGTANVQMTARKVGDNNSDQSKYLMQTIEAHVGGGQRSNASFWVALSNGEFEFSYSHNQTVPWPTGSAIGANFSLQAWAR